MLGIFAMLQVMILTFGDLMQMILYLSDGELRYLKFVQTTLELKSTSKLVTFHGGMRACLGERLALQETRILITEMVKAVEWELILHGRKG